MESTEFIWMSGQFVRWEDAKVHALTHTLHYGGGAFEGIRAYETAKGPAIFRLREHMERLIYSTRALRMELPFTVEVLVDAAADLVRRNKLKSGYIRPLAYFGYGVMGLNPRNAPIEVMIACWPWGKYLAHEMVDIKTSSFIRIHPRSTVADAKLCGHYVNSILAVLEIRGTEYHEALFLDADGNIAEGPGENFFIVKNGKLLTPPLGTILAGITRATVIEIARSRNIQVEEKVLTVKDAINADEAFFTGTAAEITPIRSLDKKRIGEGTVGPVTEMIATTYLNIVKGLETSFHHYLTFV